MLMQIRLTVAYDGGAFYGFQRQREEPTVQSVLEAALSELNRAPTEVRGAGRTDSGVHAREQVVCFFPSLAIPEERWPFAVNQRLPAELVVRKADEVSDHFDPVRQAKWKHYRYVIHQDRVPSPFTRRFVWHVRDHLDLCEMRKAGKRMLGAQDFAAFQVAGRPVRHTVRNLRLLWVRRKGKYLLIDLVADGFLYKMARSIVGTLVEVGRGAILETDVQRILREKDRSRAGPTAPAQGLFLMRVHY